MHNPGTGREQAFGPVPAQVPASAAPDSRAILLGVDPPPTAADIDEAFWQACHGGQRRMAENLLARGASINATVGYAAGFRQAPN
jgi:hypothetical protein